MRSIGNTEHKLKRDGERRKAFALIVQAAPYEALFAMCIAFAQLTTGMAVRIGHACHALKFLENESSGIAHK